MIVIPGRFPTLNSYIDVCRRNRHAAARMKRRWDETVALAARAAREPTPETWPVAVVVTVFEPDRRRDWDGSTGFVVKTVLDGLQLAGVLPNDDLRHVAPVWAWVDFDRERPRVEVEIVEMVETEGSD